MRITNFYFGIVTQTIHSVLVRQSYRYSIYIMVSRKHGCEHALLKMSVLIDIQREKVDKKASHDLLMLETIYSTEINPIEQF